MATNTNTIKTRIQLKSDTEANWNKAGPKENSNGFIPLNGELIIYSADEAHPFSRLKIGDGKTNVVNLPFVDAGTLNGNETEIVKKDKFSDFPSPGSEDKLYVDLSTKAIYHYAASSGYTQLSHFSFDVTKTTIKNIIDYIPGRPTYALVEDNIFKVLNGTYGMLDTAPLSVVTDVKEV